MTDLLNEVTELTEKERKRLLSWVSSLPEDQIVGVFQAGVKIAYQLKDQRPDIPGRISKYCAFILSGRKAGWDTLRGKGYRLAGQVQYEDFNHIRKAKAAELIKKGRPPAKRRKVLAYWGEVRQLKQDGMGFRAIASYLQKHRKLKISASYLSMLWQLVEENHEL